MIYNMNENFEKLKERVVYSLKNTDLERLYYDISKIKGPTLVSGVGGSRVVSSYASKIISSKNHILTQNVQPLDVHSIIGSNPDFQNIIACSYSGENYGVELAFSNFLNHYLLSSKRMDSPVINLSYAIHDKEVSYISLAGTLVPLSILTNYYIGDVDTVIACIREYPFAFDTDCDVFEIFSDWDTMAASCYLESTIVESGIGIPVVHNKYDFLHGRSTLSNVYHNIAIYFNSDLELDHEILAELPKYYKDVIIIHTNQDLLSEYRTLIQCMYLTKYIAESKNKDLSKVEYSPFVKKVFK